MELLKYVYFYAQKSILNAGNNKFQDLINVPRKLLEHIICSNLMQHLTQHNILYPLQHSFREKRSFESQLIEFVHDIAFNMQKVKVTKMMLL